MFRIWFSAAPHYARADIQVENLAEARYLWDRLQAAGCVMHSSRP